MIKDLLRSTFIFVLILLLVAPADVRAAKHLVDTDELNSALAKAKETREENQRQLKDFFSIPETQNILKKSSIDPKKVQEAVAQLSDEELAKLASRAQEIRSDFAGGHLSNRDLTIILIVLAAAILIVVVAD